MCLDATSFELHQVALDSMRSKSKPKPTRPELAKRLKQRLVSATISQAAFDELASRAAKDTRSVASYLRREIYRHLGIAE